MSGTSQPGGMSRRRFISLGAGALGVAAGASLLPPSLQAALATPAPAGGLESVEHVVLVMQENRAFDHYFGTMRGVRGFGDPNALRLRTGRTVFEQPDRGEAVTPYPIRGSAQTQQMDTQNVDNLSHDWADGQEAVAGGWHDGWIPAKTAATMAHYERQDIPFHYELAESFTICDAYHCSVPTGTGPNRNYWVSGYTGFEADGSRAVTNASYLPLHAGYTWGTVPERLEAAGVSWQTYQEWDNFDDNNLEGFVSFKQLVARVFAHPVLLPYQFSTLSYMYKALPSLPVDVQDTVLRALDDAVAQLSPADRSLFNRGLRRSRPGTLANQFRADIEAGTLPRVSYVVAPTRDCEHPSESSPAAGASLLYDILDALGSNPETWSKTAIFLNYDENDGYFDHVPPPLPPREIAEEHVGDLPLGLGPRVPMVVISPWTVGGYVCSQVFDHTSVTQFLERRFGFTQPEITGWRRTVAGDLTSAFDFASPRSRPSVQQPAPAPPLTPRWTPAPPAPQTMPLQEKGTRPARALPYQPDAHAVLDVATQTLTVDMANTGAESAHLALFPYAGEFELPWHFDVLGSQTATLPLPSGAYSLIMLGPNGFRREFEGSAAGAAAGLQVRADLRSGPLRISVHNPAGAAVTVRLRAGGRDIGGGSVGPGAQAAWSVPTTHGWYEAELAVDGDESFRRRWLGHIETGAESVSQTPVVVAATGGLGWSGPPPPSPLDVALGSVDPAIVSGARGIFGI